METGISNATTQRRILRLPEVMLRSGFKRAHIYNLINQGLFPQAIQLGARAVGWDSFAIDEWVDHRISGNRSSRMSAGESL